ncbi:MAG: GspE/PulE family protein [Patescibacteria group bacterium]
MKITDKTVEQLLKSAKIATADKLKPIKDQAIADKVTLTEAVVKANLITEVELTKLFAKEIGIEFTEINVKELNIEVAKQIPEKIARLYNIILLEDDYDNGIKHIAMEDPDDLQALDVIKKMFPGEVKIYIAAKFNILSALDQYRGEITSEITNLTEGDEEEEEEDVEVDVVSENSPIAQTVNLIVEYAIKNGASDIHIEPREKFVQIRYRIDGVLREANKLPRKTLNALVSRIKILSSLKIDERRAPQDGRFKINMNGRVFAFRVSTLPITNGEKVVMRVLDESTEPLTLEQLGFWGKAKKDINDASAQPHGMILVTGPTGSGKSTTLQSTLNILNSPEVNISTIEDPVEYKLEGVNQTQANPVAGMTFAAGLRALLRQDPNIIMVGEIRDGETAGLGVQAALTGHLVFSTLHTNNAATCLPRLLEMGIEPFLIASVIRVVLGQRLVRRIVMEDAESYEPSADELKEIEKSFGISGKAQWAQVLKLVNEAQAEMGLEKSNKVVFYRPKSDLKDRSGYKGRMGIYEVLKNTESIQKLIIANATSDEIQNQAIKEGMITMQLDGLIKAMLGFTSLEEILRVTRE